ncbi:NAD(P)-binding domain-containing protein [Nocardioides KLBMP 9356]|uniref:NAD(P)-binding domain-containing protein n=1 Tax=Nocardioides potassii TaxID=2911371 RepID=A0ABS9H9R5_9ACTN|nr:NAD(P)-binding domain-containing protein [Nocardioides potassii]MCF6376966.1 NAD(P)-binding domain-containing protein [Nocardioides potassii]
MHVAVLGTGAVGRTLAARLVELGHVVRLGTRDPSTTRSRDDWSELPGVELTTFAESTVGADLVVHAGNGVAALDLLAGAGDLAGKVLVDVSNPLDFSAGFPPTLTVKDTDSLGEQVQRAYPEAKVVKTLNTLTADLMAHPDRLPEPTTVFVSGDDPDAKRLVTGLLLDLGHADVLDLGGIETARGVEMWLPLWLRVMGAIGTADFNIKVVR